jgi:hypothetical protein
VAAPNPITILRGILAADDTINGLTGGRVYGMKLPDDAAMPQACVVVKPAGGPGRRGSEGWRRNRIDTSCYGATESESWELHMAVRDLLEGLRQTRDLKSVMMTAEGSTALEPDTLWPVTYASYAALTPIAV